jgi:hypothetical protein
MGKKVFKCENIYQEMVLEDDLHRTGFLSDKKGMRLREIVERKCPQEPGFMASRMTPALIAGAQKLAREWKTKKGK